MPGSSALLRNGFAFERGSAAPPSHSPATWRGGKEGGAPSVSVAPQQPGEPALDEDLVRPVALRVVAAVGRIEADHLALAPVGLERRFDIVDQRDDDLAVAGRLGLADEGVVAVEYAFVDHRIAGHLERVMLAGAEQGGGDREA